MLFYPNLICLLIKIYRNRFFKSDLVAKQHKDPKISILFPKAIDENELTKNTVCYFVQKDIFMRKWRPPDVSADDEWAVKY